MCPVDSVNHVPVTSDIHSHGGPWEREKQAPPGADALLGYLAQVGDELFYVWETLFGLLGDAFDSFPRSAWECIHRLKLSKG